MSKRRRLIWTTTILCSVPVVAVTGVVLAGRWLGEGTYVPDNDEEGITRALARPSSDRLPGLRFTDVTNEAGVRFRHFPFERTVQLPEDMGSGAAWGDYDGDGFPDLFLVNFAAPIGVSDEEMARSDATDRLFRNRGDGTFEDVTARAGVGRPHRGMGAAWGDYDGDGDLDLVVTSWGENILWENRGDGTFIDVTERAGLRGPGFWAGATWADYDLDGDLDLYVTGYVRYVTEGSGPAAMNGGAELPFTLNPSSYPPHPNRLYVNQGDGTFAERAAEAGVLDEEGRGLGAVWLDVDEDGWLDLYVANDVSDNRLFRNPGNGRFQDISYEALVADYRGAMGIAVGDWDRDLDQDFLITHWIAQENALYNSSLSESRRTDDPPGITFRDEADRFGLGQISLDVIGWATSFADFDNDGWLDLYVANGSTMQERSDPRRLIAMPDHLYWNRGREEGFYEVGGETGFRAPTPGVSRGGAVADYDRDGDLDLVIVTFGGSPRLLRNDTEGGHWLALRLEGRAAHPTAVGARAVAFAGGGAFLREVGAAPSYLSQDDPELHFGLGDARSVDSVVVRWPGGARQVVRGLAVDARWHLVEGREPVKLGGPSREEVQRFWQLDRQAGRAVRAGAWDEAVVHLASMLAIDPSHEDARYNLGNAYLELGRYDDAVAEWRRLLEVNPASSRAWIQIGIVHAMAEAGALFDLAGAAAAFGAAHRLNREESRPLVLWGAVALALGDVVTAEDVLASAHRMNDRSASALYLSGYLMWKAGDAGGAADLLGRARDALGGVQAVAGASGEGDTRTEHLAEERRAAEGRRLFASCLDALERADPPTRPDRDYPCVDRVLAAMR